MSACRSMVPTCVVAAVVVAAGCGSQSTSPPSSSSGESAASTDSSAAAAPAAAALRTKVKAVAVIRGAASPLDVASAPGDGRHLFVVEQGGLIRVATNGRLSPTPFLDLRKLVSTGGERGLLGLAFHPRYATNGRFFVDYTDTKGNTVVAEYRAKPGALTAGTGGRALLHIDQPFSNHNGGNVTFGPDGYLYIGMGDGGSGGDPGNRAQNPNVLLGKLLRIDVDHRSRGKQYAIPRTNPYASGRGGAPEVWAVGLRNPWRFSFDRTSGDLWIGDVGQDRIEEVDHVRRSGRPNSNYGWRLFEGNAAYQAGARRPARYVAPTATYPHRDGCSVTGGYVVRNPKLPSLLGTYLYADFCTGFVRGVTPAGRVVDLTKALGGGFGQITSFGQDGAGRIYVVSAGGTIRVLRAR